MAVPGVGGLMGILSTKREHKALIDVWMQELSQATTRSYSVMGTTMSLVHFNYIFESMYACSKEFTVKREPG